MGCANAEALALSGAERAGCDQKFGAELAKAPVLERIDPAKRARWDKTAGRQDRSRKTAQGPSGERETPLENHGPGSSLVEHPPLAAVKIPF